MSRSMSRWQPMVARSLALGVCAAALVTYEAVAQKRVSLDGHGGITLPTGRLGTIADAGPSVGIQMSYPMSTRTSLRLSGDLDDLKGARMGSAQAPDIRLWRAGVGMDRELFSPRPRAPVRGRRGVVTRSPSPWRLVASAGVGATRFDSQRFTTTGPNPVPKEFRETYFATDLGLMLRYRASDRVQLRAATLGSVTFANRDDTAVLAGLDPRREAKAFGPALTVPLSMGLTIRM